jgi:hypothetical protein
VPADIEVPHTSDPPDPPDTSAAPSARPGRKPDRTKDAALLDAAVQVVAEHRCIAPRNLVPTGRTETWLEAAELPKLRKRLPR